MIAHRYKLQPHTPGTKQTCPECSQRKAFVRYIDTETNLILSDHVGRCDREDQCGYHYTPKQFFDANGIKPVKSDYTPKKELPKPTTYIDTDVFTKSLYGYDENNFTSYLVKNYGLNIANGLISKYYIGTSTFKQGSTIFWQIDTDRNIRSGEVLLYNKEPLKRVHGINTWVHSHLKIPNFNLRQCLFGEHLLKNNTKPVGVVEAAKTAIIASIYIPDITWVATSGKNGLSIDKLNTLRGHKVTLYPDLGAYDYWKEKADLYGYNTSRLLEDMSTQKQLPIGYDLADFFLEQASALAYANLDAPAYTTALPEAPIKPLHSPSEPLTNPLPKVIEKVPVIAPIKAVDTSRIKENWTTQIEELEEYFKAFKTYIEPIKLDQASTIRNLPSFLDSHLQTVKHNNGNITFKPYMDRLIQVRSIIQKTV